MQCCTFSVFIRRGGFDESPAHRVGDRRRRGCRPGCRGRGANLARRLDAALADPDARTIVLTRDEALLTLGIVNGVAELIDHNHTPAEGGAPEPGVEGSHVIGSRAEHPDG